MTFLEGGFELHLGLRGELCGSVMQGVRRLRSGRELRIGRRFGVGKCRTLRLEVEWG